MVCARNHGAERESTVGRICETDRFWASECSIASYSNDKIRRVVKWLCVCVLFVDILSALRQWQYDIQL